MAYSRSRRRPGRRDNERKRFSRLIKEVERIRIRERITNAELAREIGTGVNVVSGWRNGRAVGRRKSVELIEAFLQAYRSHNY